VLPHKLDEVIARVLCEPSPKVEQDRRGVRWLCLEGAPPRGYENTIIILRAMHSMQCVVSGHTYV
jgi:hypothetical protein